MEETRSEFPRVLLQWRKTGPADSPGIGLCQHVKWCLPRKLIRDSVPWAFGKGWSYGHSALHKNSIFLEGKQVFSMYHVAGTDILS